MCVEKFGVFFAFENCFKIQQHRSRSCYSHVQ